MKKERALKMNGKKIFKGEKYEFFKTSDRGKKGGNGCVYDVEITNAEIKYPVVAKFFEYNKKEKDKRYERFKKESLIVQDIQEKVEGIMNIIDRFCPVNVPDNRDDAWYLMPKAKPYSIKYCSDLNDKLRDMYELATIISKLHERKIAHRDIKPENILIYEGRIVLCDFGLVWTINQDRITDENERIGPYKILPPELENIDLNSTLDFCPSDVYLFAKVLWMTLKENDSGFRGQYNRRDNQIYLFPERFNILTLEPIHCLIEKATRDEMTERITIDECIYYLKQQEMIIKGGISEEEINNLRYEELIKELVNQNVPDGHIYNDYKKIFKILGTIVEISSIYLKNINEPKKKRKIQVTSMDILKDGMAEFNFYLYGKKSKSYLFKVKTLTYLCNDSTSSQSIIVSLEDIEIYDKEYIIYGAASLSFGSEDKNIIITDDYEIIVEC